MLTNRHPIYFRQQEPHYYYVQGQRYNIYYRNATTKQIDSTDFHPEPDIIAICLKPKTQQHPSNAQLRNNHRHDAIHSIRRYFTPETIQRHTVITAIPIVTTQQTSMLRLVYHHGLGGTIRYYFLKQHAATPPDEVAWMTAWYVQQLTRHPDNDLTTDTSGWIMTPFGLASHIDQPHDDKDDPEPPYSGQPMHTNTIASYSSSTQECHDRATSTRTSSTETPTSIQNSVENSNTQLLTDTELYHR